METNREITEIIEWVSLAKGDTPGHPFRGNQYGEGQGVVDAYERLARNVQRGFNSVSYHEAAEGPSYSAEREAREQAWHDLRAATRDLDIFSDRLMADIRGDIGANPLADRDAAAEALRMIDDWRNVTGVMSTPDVDHEPIKRLLSQAFGIPYQHTPADPALFSGKVPGGVLSARPYKIKTSMDTVSRLLPDGGPMVTKPGPTVVGRGLRVPKALEAVMGSGDGKESTFYIMNTERGAKTFDVDSNPEGSIVNMTTDGSVYFQGDHTYETDDGVYDVGPIRTDKNGVLDMAAYEAAYRGTSTSDGHGRSSGPVTSPLYGLSEFSYNKAVGGADPQEVLPDTMVWATDRSGERVPACTVAQLVTASTTNGWLDDAVESEAERKYAR